MVLPLGIRLHNPGNIEQGQPWEGLASQQVHPRFARFVTPEYGIRAIHKILQAYHNKYNIQDIAHYIARWAPPKENNTPAYIKHVDDIVTEATAEEPINIMDPGTAFHMVTGIIAHENSNFQYPDEVVWNGLKLAGVKV